MNSRRRSHILCVLAILAANCPEAAAQDALDDVKGELSTLRTEIGSLRREVEELRALLGRERRTTETAAGPQGTTGSQTQTPQPSIEVLQTQVAELAQVKVESTSRMPVKIFGTIHTNAFANSAAPNWLDSPNLVNPAPADGHNGSFSATLRQTRLGLTVDGPAIKGVRTNATVAMDFFAGIPGFVTGQVMGLPRLLFAYARFEGKQTAVEVGQDHMIMAPVDPTSLASFAFPALFRSGNLYLRTPQARIEQALGAHLRVIGGIVAPIGGDVPGEDYRFVPQAFSGERSRRPGVQARIVSSTGDRDTHRHADLGVSGHYGWERRPTALARSFAGAVDFTIRRDYFGAAGEWFVGQNVDAFGGGVGLDARAQGGWAELQLHQSERLSFAAGFGSDRLRGAIPAALPRHRNRSAYGTALFSLTPEIQASFEYHWLATQPSAGSERRNHHFDWVLAYKF